MSDDKLVDDVIAKMAELEAKYQPDPFVRHRGSGYEAAAREIDAGDAMSAINRASLRVADARVGMYASYPSSCKALRGLRAAVRDASDAMFKWESALSDLVDDLEDDS